MNKFQKIVSVLLVIIIVLLSLNYFEMRYSNKLQNIIIENLYNRNG